MGIFGPGVGGGFLAAAGGLQGLGQGMQMVGQQGMRMQLMERENELAQKREETIERLRAASAQQLEAQHQTGEERLQQKGQEFEKGQTQIKLVAASTAADKAREFEHQENIANRAAAMARTKETAQSRRDVASIRADAQNHNNAGKGKGWVIKEAPYQTMNSKEVKSGTNIHALNQATGRVYAPAGDIYLPADNSEPGGFRDPKSVARAPAAYVQRLLQYPQEKITTGQWAGMTNEEAFEAKWHYLPTSYINRMAGNQAQGGGSSSSSVSIAAPSFRVPGRPGQQQNQPAPTPSGEASSPTPGTEDRTDDQEGDADAAASEGDTSQFQSGAMGAYNANAQ